ncbi:hypothetical protein [Micromonospora sp. ATA51]|uniref:hypothetical protein n=1 Tax=Micromonospora sp. ATA51 TaxID=2806098 RepID=UPI001A55B80E|nr:hypothetical protein [Micromonospora sp. ATA51]MBM0228062.1 hypothetical protein [Micromonospora sp. ATA51]
MWLGAQIVRAAGGDVSGLTVAVGALAVLATLVTALLGFRGTLRTSDVQREANFDQRVDARLRLDVFAAGLDPDELGRRSSREPPQ